MLSRTVPLEIGAARVPPAGACRLGWVVAADFGVAHLGFDVSEVRKWAVALSGWTVPV